MPKIQERLSTNYNVGTPWPVFLEQTKGYRVLLDVCATRNNTKVGLALGHYYTKDDDGLAQDWAGDLLKLSNRAAFLDVRDLPVACWMNPPYGREIERWVQKAVKECWKGATVIALLPARPGPRWFGWVWSYTAQRPRRWVKALRFLPGRIQFDGMPTSAMFPSMVVIFQLDRVWSPRVWPGAEIMINKWQAGDFLPAIVTRLEGSRIYFRYPEDKAGWERGYVVRRAHGSTWYLHPWEG